MVFVKPTPPLLTEGEPPRPPHEPSAQMRFAFKHPFGASVASKVYPGPRVTRGTVTPLGLTRFALVRQSRALATGLRLFYLPPTLHLFY
jgi:hypothetical protein